MYDFRWCITFHVREFDFLFMWFWRHVPSYQHLHVVSFNVRSLQIPLMKELFEMFCRWFKLFRKVFCMKKSFCPWATGQLTLDLAQVADTSLQDQYILSVLVIHKYYSLPSGIYRSVLSLGIAICEGLHTVTFLVKVSNTVSDVHFQLLEWRFAVYEKNIKRKERDKKRKLKVNSWYHFIFRMKSIDKQKITKKYLFFKRSLKARKRIY